MGNLIKMKLLEVGRKQVDLLPELRKRGYPRLHQTALNKYINGVDLSPQAERVKKIIYDILDEWKNAC